MLRIAKADDASFLATLYAECSDELLTLPISKEEMQARIQSARGGKLSIWIIEDEEGERIGAAELSLEQEITRVYRIKLCIEKEHQGLGYGKAALMKIEDMLFNRLAASKIEVWTLEGNTAWLKNMGYHKEAELSYRWFKGKPISVVVMSKAKSKGDRS